MLSNYNSCIGNSYPCLLLYFIFDKKSYKFIGEKVNIKFTNLVTSHTTCFGTIVEADTLELISRSVTHFRLQDTVKFISRMELSRTVGLQKKSVLDLIDDGQQLSTLFKSIAKVNTLLIDSIGIFISLSPLLYIFPLQSTIDIPIIFGSCLAKIGI